MTKITGRFKRTELTDANGKQSTEWAAGATVIISLIEGQTVALSKGGAELSDVPATTFVLDDKGRVPEGTEIIGNDTLWPEGTLYEINIDDEYNSLANLYGFAAIEGAEVDLSALSLHIFQPGVPAYIVLQPRPVPFPHPKFERPAPPLPAKRIRGANYSGFIATNIYGAPGETFPVAIGSVSHLFYLPYVAVVREASIFVEVVPQREQTVLVELFSIDDDKMVCKATIEANKLGRNAGYFDKVAILKQGEYRLCLSVNPQGSLSRLRGLGTGKLPEICFSV